MIDQLPEQVQWLLSIFKQHQYELYLVGGCVRDLLLHRPVHDYDFTTNATPAEMMQMLEAEPCTIIPTGLKHGTITVRYQKEAMEVTTYRSDGEYQHHRKPKQVTFSKTLIDDLSRRDFTINAIAYHPDIGLIDPFHGQRDLQNHMIRCVGEPNRRFNEDALRILRALRFSFQLKFTLEEQCLISLKQQVHLLKHISKERIREEFTKMLMSDAPDLLLTLRETGVMPYIIEEYPIIYHITQESKWHIYDVFLHTNAALNHTAGYTLCEKLAIVCHDLGKAQTKTLDEEGHAHFYGHPVISEQLAKAALQRLKYPRKTIQTVSTLILYHDYYVTPKARILRRFLAQIDLDYAMAASILRVQYADDCAKNMERSLEKLANIDACNAVLKELKDKQGCLRRTDLRINGHDLKQLGYKGKQIGAMLQRLYDEVIEHPKHNTKAYLLSIAKQIKLDD